MSKLVDAALHARDLLADGWCQRVKARAVVDNRTGEAKEEVCLAQAMGRAEDQFHLSKSDRWGFRELAYDAIARRTGDLPALACLADYNDAPERTKQDILDLMDDVVRAAKELEA